MKNYLIILLFLISSCTWDPGDSILQVVNHTGHDVSIEWEKDSIPSYPAFNKTEYYLENPTYNNDTLSAGESGRFGWKRFITQSKNKKVNLFVYKMDSLRKYNSIDYLNEKRIYKRYSYTKEELEKCNWIVIISH
ncbi:hypothetical protein DBR11_23865 [Pedobacter sp. HMWF019]|uniref:hypothetical protein n=1 Tax=Pedobacter sp. HMWF019 TaxID=2056856 RepID=UPI000D33B270|nr:hypothetical protein [Pedobacter sp. HMWF019]PTS94217.1 hypothetical protein DBR11_23865 [Pedobacter sp. HMWF019]